MYISSENTLYIGIYFYYSFFLKNIFIILRRRACCMSYIGLAASLPRQFFFQLDVPLTWGDLSTVYMFLTGDEKNTFPLLFIDQMNEIYRNNNSCFSEYTRNNNPEKRAGSDRPVCYFLR